MAQNIFEVLGQVRGGVVVNEASQALQDLIAAVRDAGRKGIINLSIVVEPDSTDDRVITMTPDYTVRPPKKKRAKGIFFVRPDGSVTKEDPAQLEMQMERQRQGIATLATSEAALAKVGTGV